MSDENKMIYGRENYELLLKERDELQRKLEVALSEITLGEFTLRKWPDGSLWIGKDSGEGMQSHYGEEYLEGCLSKFWDENF